MISRQKTILVTGASGMLGSKLCVALAKGGFGVEKERFEISSTKEAKKMAAKLKRIDAMIHCAAMTEVNKCENERRLCRKVNVIGTRNIVDLARCFGANLIYISTPMVFSGHRGNYKERDIPKPLNYYARSKLDGEKEVLKYSNGLVVRANPIGARPPGAHPSFIQWFVNAAKNNKSFTLFSDVRINPISTLRLSQTIVRLLEDFKPGILHLGSLDVANKADIWRLVVSKFPMFTGRVVEKSVDETEAARIAKRPKDMWLNVDNASSLGLKMPRWKKEIELVLKELI